MFACQLLLSAHFSQTEENANPNGSRIILSYNAFLYQFHREEKENLRTLVKKKNLGTQ